MGPWGPLPPGWAPPTWPRPWSPAESGSRCRRALKFVYTGTCPPWVTGKDLILHTIGDIGVDGARYRAMEFTGEAIAASAMADRFSMANMAVEAGAKNGIIAPDKITLEYVQGPGPAALYKSMTATPEAAYTL